MPEITLEHITHHYGDKEVLKDFSFSFVQGKTTCLLGPSGCGKTTVLRLISGLETPVSGSLWPHFTVYDNIAFGLKEKRERNIKEKVSDILDLFGISDKAQKYPHQLSGGQKQMVAIARSLVLQPQVLLMDEPLANIDTHLKEDILGHLKTVQKQQLFAMLYVTHDHKEAFHTGDHILVMNAGKIEAAGTKEEICNSTSNYVKSFLKF